MLLNFHYPHAEEPTALLARRGGGLPEGCELQEWDAESMVVFGFPSAVPSEVAAAVDALYRAIHGIGGAYEVTGALE